LGMTLSAIGMSRASGYFSLVVTRALHGIFCGLGGPSSLAMLSEIIPGEWRSVMFIMFTSFQSLGDFYACCGLMLYMPDLKNDCCWNKCILWSALPAGLMLLASIAKLQPSVCYLVARGEIDQARMVLKQIAIVNENIEVSRLLKGRKYVDLFTTPTAGQSKHYSRRSKIFQQFETASSIMTVLCQRSTLKKVILFSILAGVGNIGTAGMSEIWPAILRRLTDEAHVGTAAEGLAMLAVVGLPCGIFGAVLTFSRFSSHRLLITFAGWVGAIGMVGLAVIEKPAGMVGISMIMASSAGRLQESITFAFCAESFDTRIRSSATGVVIFWGSMFSVVSPMMTAVMGEEAYICMAGIAFLVGSFASVPMKETKTEWRDETKTDGRILSDVEGLDQADSDSASTSEEEDDSEKLSWLFENGTLGATMELGLLMGLMGLVPGVSLNCFYASMSYSVDYFKDRSIFAKMMLSVICAQIPLLMFMPHLTRWLDKKFMIHRSILIRLGGCIFALFALNLCNAFIRTECGLLVLGWVIGLASISVLDTSILIADNLPNGGLRTFVQMGFVTGGVVPLFIEPFVGYGPGSALFVKVRFFVVPCCLCLLAGVIFCQYHLEVIYYLKPNQTSKRGNIADLAGAYLKLQLQCFPGMKSYSSATSRDASTRSSELAGREGLHRPSMTEDAVAAEQRWCSLETLKALVAGFIILVQQVACHFFAGLFPMVNTPEQALKLCFYMISGDMLGSLFTLSYQNLAGFRRCSSVRWAMQYLLLCLLGLGAAALSAIPSVFILRNKSMSINEDKLNVSIGFKGHVIIPMAFNAFFLGAIAKGGLGSCFHEVQRAKNWGALIGLVAVLCCYATILSDNNVPLPAEGVIPTDNMLWLFPFKAETVSLKLGQTVAKPWSLIHHNSVADKRMFVISPDGAIPSPWDS